MRSGLLAAVAASAFALLLGVTAGCTRNYGDPPAAPAPESAAPTRPGAIRDTRPLADQIDELRDQVRQMESAHGAHGEMTGMGAASPPAAGMAGSGAASPPAAAAGMGGSGGGMGGMMGGMGGMMGGMGGAAPATPPSRAPTGDAGAGAAMPGMGNAAAPPAAAPSGGMGGSGGGMGHM